MGPFAETKGPRHAGRNPAIYKIKNNLNSKTKNIWTEKGKVLLPLPPPCKGGEYEEGIFGVGGKIAG